MMKTKKKYTRVGPVSSRLTYKQIYDMQTEILKELEKVGRLPKDHPRRVAYGEKVRQQQMNAGIITVDNKLTKAFGG